MSHDIRLRVSHGDSDPQLPELELEAAVTVNSGSVQVKLYTDSDDRAAREPGPGYYVTQGLA